jgi:2-amino-4-hydroxy-6-hydroxymethyldihydropteridine diphosphokinase
LDIILNGKQVVASKELVIPQPEMMNRAFVLIPLKQIEPDLNVTILGPIDKLIERIQDQELIKL